MPKLNWTDADEIGFQLHEAHPDLDPLTVNFTALRDLVTSLDEFAGDPAATSEPVLEAIQMAWMEYFNE